MNEVGRTTVDLGRAGLRLGRHPEVLGGPHPGGEVTIEPARPDDLAMILLGSYGLSDRETDIVLRISRGMATKDIAAELMISPHTVRDHIKAIFEKAEATSSGELVAALLTNHVLEDFHRSVLHVGADG